MLRETARNGGGKTSRENRLASAQADLGTAIAGSSRLLIQKSTLHPALIEEIKDATLAYNDCEVSAGRVPAVHSSMIISSSKRKQLTLKDSY